MHAIGVFGITAAATTLYTAARYDGHVRYEGPDVDTPAGNLRGEDGAPDASNHASIYAAAGIAGAMGGAFVAGPRIAEMLGGANPAHRADTAVFGKIGAGLLGVGAGLALGTTIAKLTD